MIGIIIQARMGSTRLAGKILKDVGGKTLLEHILFRLSYLKSSVKIVIATTDKEIDDKVVEFCKVKNIDFFRGSEDNVLKRYYDCANHYKFEQIIRLTADNPFYDIEELDNLINIHLEKNMDFTYSFPSLPIGVGAEIFNFKSLQKSFYEAKEPHHLEHVDEYILENPKIFKTFIIQIPKEKNFPNIRLTVDTLDDYKRAKYIVENSKNEFITTVEAIKLCMQYV